MSKSVTAKIQYPPNLDESLLWQPLIHVTWTTKVLGVVDDLFMETYLNTTADPMYAVVNVQS